MSARVVQTSEHGAACGRGERHYLEDARQWVVVSEEVWDDLRLMLGAPPSQERLARERQRALADLAGALGRLHARGAGARREEAIACEDALCRLEEWRR